MRGELVRAFLGHAPPGRTAALRRRVRATGHRLASARARRAVVNRAESRRATLAWAVLLTALLVGVALRLGAADWYTDHPAIAPDGRVIALPNTFISVDHPFHIARSKATLDALRDGWLPRWFAFHQGGYPAEFYPPGGSLLVALVYALGLGLIPLPVAHKLVIIAILLMPPIAYWAIARRARLPTGVAVLAAAWHLAVPGEWFGGGSQELVEQGLMANVLAAYLLPFVLLTGADWLRRGDRLGLAWAAGLGTLTIYTNPRSVVGLAATCAAVTIAALSEGMWPRRDRAVLSAVAMRATALGLVIALLSSALVLPLRANQGLYQFEHYVEFTGPFDVFRWFGNALRLHFLPALVCLGLVVASWRRAFFGRALALQFVFTFLVVELVGWQFREAPLFAQLEGPRLMPLLRPAAIFLAALGAHELLRAVLRLALPRIAAPLAGASLLAVTAAAVLSPGSPIDPALRGLPHVETSDQPGFAAVAASALQLEALSTPEDRPLVLGNPLARHTSFWFATLTNRTTFQGNWLWGWRDVAYGEHGALRDERAALNRDFLARHGLTMVVIARESLGGLLQYADTLPYLRQLHAGDAGGYAIYRVDSSPVPANGWVGLDNGGMRLVRASPERLEVSGRTDQTGIAWFAVNDYPGWRASVNGTPVPLALTPEGYIAVPVPAGEIAITLDYTVTRLVWLGRGLVIAGGCLLLALVLHRPRGTCGALSGATAAVAPLAAWEVDKMCQGEGRDSPGEGSGSGEGTANIIGGGDFARPGQVEETPLGGDVRTVHS